MCAPVLAQQPWSPTTRRMRAVCGGQRTKLMASTSAAECDPEGLVDYGSLASYAFYILQYLAQNAALSS